MKTLVVFTDPGGTRLGWLLRRGYRHVFVCIADGTSWIMFDPRDGLPVISVVPPSDLSLADWFRKQGYIVVETTQGKPTRSPLMVSHCVGMVKHILGIRAPFVQTPYSLFSYLERKAR